MKRDTIMRNLALLNQLWDGGSIDVTRRTTSSYKLENVRLTILLLAQSGTYARFLEESGDLSRDIGFVARCLFAYPASTQGTRFYKELPNTTPCLDKFNGKISNLLSREMVLNKRGGVEPIKMGLAPDAKKAWIEYHDTIESMLADTGDLKGIRDIASKSAENVARLACLLQVFSNELIPTVISLGSVERAIKIAAWHLNESLYFAVSLENAGKDEEEKLINWLVSYCKKHAVSRVTKAEIQKVGPNRLRKKAKLNPCLSSLEKAGILRMIRESNTQYVEINPNFLTETVVLNQSNKTLKSIIDKPLSAAETIEKYPGMRMKGGMF